jgi:hypothetical protein
MLGNGVETGVAVTPLLNTMRVVSVVLGLKGDAQSMFMT